MKTIICIVCLFFVCIQTFAQSKYFEKRYAFSSHNNNGLEIFSYNDTFKIAGQLKKKDSNNNIVWQAQVINSDDYGNMFNSKEYYHIYEGALTTDFFVFDMCTASNNQYAISGRLETHAFQAEYHYDAYLMLVNEECDSTAFYTYRYNDNNTSSWGMCQSLDEEHLVLAGQARVNNQSVPWLLKVNELGETQWEYVYAVENENSTWFKTVAPALDGGYYVAGITNYYAQNTSLSDILVIKVDSEGNEIARKTIDFGFFDSVGKLVIAQDGGIVITTFDNADPFTNDYGVGKLLKLDAGLNTILWDLDVFSDQAVQSVVELADGNFVVCGSYKFPNGMVDLAIAKVSSDGELLWRRTYGGSWSDGAYDLTESPDGGFALIGRSDSTVVDTAYLYFVKTNCMGLLTEPQASFEEMAIQNGIYQFNNTSQYVYADSLDGGHFIWDFGDGTPPVTINNSGSPQHTYTFSGHYTVSVTAVVCNDTSFFQKSIPVLVTGFEETGVWGGDFEVYPNPANHKLAIKTKLTQDFQVRIYDNLGKMLYENPHYQTATDIDISHFSAGIYFVEIKEKDAVFLEKIVVF